MSLKEAKKYIDELHKKQGNPYIWPDFLTGLPDKAAILLRLDEIYPRMGEYAISLVRIANVNPYLIKYGTDKHAEIIEWAAAILKSISDDFKDGFVGALGTHDFVVIGKTSSVENITRESAGVFRTKVKTFYSEDDRKKGYVISFLREGEKVDVGLMELISVTLKEKINLPKEKIISHLTGQLSRMELHSV
jgi:GGDEF domain-containing protein